MRYKFWLGSLILLIFLACSSKKKKSLSGDDPVDIKDFIESFESQKLPYTFADTMLAKKANDSTNISQKIFTQFVPDTVLQQLVGKGNKLKIYPEGKIEIPKEETYLVVKVLNGDKKAVAVLCFDKQNKFTHYFPALIPDANSNTQQFFTIDNNKGFTKFTQRKNSDGSISEGKDVYVYDDATKTFTLVMTDALDEKSMELINPIDTLAGKTKFAGDYVKDKKNIVSVRDNKNPSRITFFIHFEKAGTSCTGELKGEASFTSANVAEYHANGDLCALQFTFTNSSVTLKELQGCGSRRGVDCSFDGTYPKKKEAKKPAKKAGKK